MLYPRLTYGADKRYLRRKSLIKIYRREIRGERVSKGDVNEPALPPPFLLFVERRTRIRKGEGGERGDNRRREDRGRRWSILRQFHRSLSSRVSFFFREIVEKRKVYLFILFLISEKFITSGLLLLFIVIKEKYLDRINFQSTIRQEKKSKKKNLLRVECTLRAKKVGSGFIIKIVETIFSISIFPPSSLSLSLSLLASERNTVSNKSHTFYSTEP